MLVAPMEIEEQRPSDVPGRPGPTGRFRCAIHPKRNPRRGTAIRSHFFPSNKASTDSPVFSTRRGFWNGLNAGLWVRSDPLGR